MDSKIEQKLDTANFLSLGLYAFAGFGLEILLIMAESSLLGIQPSNWSVRMNCIHWTITCILWGSVSLYLAKYSKKRYGFDLFETKEKLRSKDWILPTLIVTVSIVVTMYLNGGFKPVLEYKNLGVMKFIFQYVYYLFESILIVLTIVFGQKYGEGMFNKKSLPWGGLFLAFTWGMMHILTQDIATGIYAISLSIEFGVLYILLKKNIKYTYILIALVFIL